MIPEPSSSTQESVDLNDRFSFYIHRLNASNQGMVQMYAKVVAVVGVSIDVRQKQLNWPLDCTTGPKCF